MNAANQPSSANNYFINAEDAAEMARLLKQDRMVTTVTGGPLAELSDLSGIHRVLDVACGPGGWVLEVASRYRAIEIAGIDISRRMISYARAQAQGRNLDNAVFFEMDATQPLHFPDRYFDLVNGRFLIGFLGTSLWPPLLAELRRVTRSGGIIRLTEAETALTNSAPLEQLNAMFAHALFQAGQSFSPDGRTLSITPMLERFLRDAGCQRVKSQPYSINWSAGQAAHQIFKEDLQYALPLLEPFLKKWEGLTHDTFQRLYTESMADIYDTPFCALIFFLTVWGEVIHP